MTTTAGKHIVLSSAISAPCPAWCTEPAGHPYDSYLAEDGAPARSHSHGFAATGDTAADLIQCVAWRAGVEQSNGPPVIRVWIGGNCHEEDLTSPTQARRLAIALLEAADMLERIQ